MRKKPRLRLIFLLLSFLNNKTYALSTQKDPSKKSLESFELSIGSSLMFIKDSDRAELQKGKKITIPTNTTLFTLNYTLNKNWSLLCFFNLPDESQNLLLMEN